ncbi:MAG TPA: WD40 repeat domain-containing protein, partial [Planctomycetaceae bacterium]|nr:WD40 repeat domain-containing protein [Planctomycetaceae bacterium]
MTSVCNRGVRTRCFVWLAAALIAGALPLTASGKDVKTAGWAMKPDPPASPVKWPEKLSLNIAQADRADELLFPTNLSEYVLSNLKHYESDGGELWNLTTGKRVGAIKGSPSKAHKRALSPDGQYLAINVLGGDIPNLVEVWSLSTGQKVASWQADEAKMSMTILDFAGPGEVLTYTFGNPTGKFAYHLRVWDAQSGKPARQFDLKQTIGGDKHYQVSPGRRYLATMHSGEVAFFDLTNGEKVGAVAPPNKTEAGENVNSEGFRFSPDGSEIAVISDSFNATTIRAFDLETGDAKLTHDLPSFKFGLQHASSYKGPSVDYATDGSAFLFFGSALVDRESGMVLWTYQSPPADYNHWPRILTPAGLISSVGSRRDCKVQV